jgi:carbamate kinase
MPEILQRVVVALGGNAISSVGEQGTIEEQFAHTQHAVRVVCDVIEDGYQLVITHGNGPQVGNVLRRVELARRELYPLPLEVCVADTQAGMGYMIGQCLTNELLRRGRERLTSTIVTTVLVDASDPAFRHPSKPIGPRLSASDAAEHVERDGWQVREVEPGEFQRIVPSPRPKKILELKTIAALVERGELVICCGGGGIPVLWTEGAYQGAPAVIDKDLTSAMLATQLDADFLIMLTSVDHAYINYGKSTQSALGPVTVDEAEELIRQGQFADGSMLPKMEAAIEFVRTSARSDAEAIITSNDKLLAALDQTAGTRIVGTG